MTPVPKVGGMMIKTGSDFNHKNDSFLGLSGRFPIFRGCEAGQNVYKRLFSIWLPKHKHLESEADAW